MKKNNGFALLLVGLCFVACTKPGATPVDIPGTKQAVLKDLSLNVIVPIYKDLVTATGELSAEIKKLQTPATKTETQLTIVKGKWRAAREPWESSEGFLYGPAEAGLDPALDTWPVDITAMNEVITSTGDITATSLATNNEARGFHLVEYLAWGPVDKTKTVTDLTARELEYMVAAAEDISTNAKKLYDAWRPDSGNYAKNFTDVANGVHKNYATAIEEIVGGIIGICTEVGEKKIPEAFGETAAKPEEEESWFSHNSKVDFTNNIRSIDYIYNGKYGTFVGKGITELTKLKDAALDTKIKAKITETIKSIDDIPGTFTEAITNNRPAVAKAVKTIIELRDILQNELNPLLKTL